MLAGVILLLAPVVAVGAGSPQPVAAVDPNPTLTTDKADYAPNETVHITGADFAPLVDYDIVVIRPDGSIIKGDGNFNPDDSYTCPGGAAECWDTVTADEAGSFIFDYILDGIAGTYEARAYLSPWNGDRSLAPLASTTFTDGNVRIRSQAAGVTYNLSWTVHSTTDCTGPATDSDSQLIGFAGGNRLTIGVGNTQSILFTAATTATNPSGAPFRDWNAVVAGDPFTPIAPTSACIPGFTGGGTREYFAFYGNVAPLVTAAPVSGNEGASVTETASFSDANPSQTHTCTIDWGDSTAPTAGTISESNGSGTCTGTHVYADNGSFTVAVTVSDGTASTSDTDTATIANVAPTATLANNGPVDEGSPATVSFSAQFEPSSDDTAAGFHYAFSCSNGDLSAATYAGSGTAASTMCTFSDNGSYTVKGRIIDKDDGFTEYTTSVTVNNVAPVVSAGADDTIDEGDTFSGGGSFTDPGADTWTATVNYGDGSGTNPLALVGKTFSLSHLYADNGSFTVTVCVTDDDGGMGCDSLLVTVNNVAPTITAVSASPNPVFTGFNTHVSGTFTDPGVNDTHTGSIDWGDGTLPQALTIGGSNTNGTFSSQLHAYTAAGTYDVEVCITDKDGGMACQTFPVTVLSSGAFRNGTFVTNSSFGLQDDLSPWEVDDFEILKQKDSTIVATNPGQFYEHIRVVNVSGATQTIQINATWPSTGNPLTSFVTQGANPVHCYLQLAGSSSWTEVACIKTVGTGSASVSIPNVPAGATVWVTVHLDYAGKGQKDSSMLVRPFDFDATWTVGLLTGQGGASIAGRPKKVTTVYGFVTDASGNPIIGATVTLYSSSGTVLATYITGADGFYVFFSGMTCADLNGGTCSWGTGTLSLPGGTYKLSFAAAGYLPVGPFSFGVANTQAARIDQTLTA